MNPLADLKADTLRTLFIYIVPGIIASLPWLFIVAHVMPNSVTFAEQHQPGVGIALLLLSLTLGKFLNGVGSWWEVLVNDRILAKSPEFPNFKLDWERYLRTAFVHAPVSVAYIHNLTQALKFELNVAVGLVVFVLGQIPQVIVLGTPSVSATVWIMVAGFSAAAFLFWNSYSSSRVLAFVRKGLSQGVLLQGAEARPGTAV